MHRLSVAFYLTVSALQYQSISTVRADAARRPPGRLVVIPDSHGDPMVLEIALALGRALPRGYRPQFNATKQFAPLMRTERIDVAQIVSLGDSVDRGPDAMGCYALLERVGATCILGNHDWINMLGVAPDDDPTTLHDEALFAPYVSDADVAAFGGWDQRRAAFGPTGRIGRRIREHFEVVALLPAPWKLKGELPPPNAAATLFVHAGLLSSLALEYGDALEMATEGRSSLQKSLAGDDSGLISQLFDHVLQTRDLVYAREDTACADLRKTLAHFGAARLVVGHTPQESRLVGLRCDGRLVLTDVAMSRWLMNPHGPAEETPHPVALELTYAGNEGEELLTSFMAVYPSEEQRLPPFATKDVEVVEVLS